MQNSILLKKIMWVSMLLSLAAVCACTPMTGRPSLTLLSNDLTTSSNTIKVMGNKDKETEALHWFLLFFLVGEAPTHESVAQKLLDKHSADVLLDAELTSFAYGIPYIYMRIGTCVKGTPAKFVDRGEQ